jgi:hypothetical protein
MKKYETSKPIAVSFAQWIRDKAVADGAPKLLLRLDMKRYTIEELFDMYSLIDGHCEIKEVK